METAYPNPWAYSKSPLNTDTEPCSRYEQVASDMLRFRLRILQKMNRMKCNDNRLKIRVEYAVGLEWMLPRIRDGHCC
jgi:hypothetical protein